MFAVKSQAASIGQEMWCTQSLLESSVELTNTRCGSGYVLTLFDKVKVVGEGEAMTTGAECNVILVRIVTTILTIEITLHSKPHDYPMDQISRPNSYGC